MRRLSGPGHCTVHKQLCLQESFSHLPSSPKLAVEAPVSAGPCESLGWLLPLAFASAEEPHTASAGAGISLLQLCGGTWWCRALSQSHLGMALRGQSSPAVGHQHPLAKEVHMSYAPFGEHCYILERFPLHSQATGLPLMEKGRMCLSRASQVRVQHTTFYGMHVPNSSTVLPAPLAWSWAGLQHH